jgi:hypothetical protein
MKTIQSIEHLQGVIQGAYLALIDEHIIIEEEKNFGYDVYENPKGGFCVKTEFTDYYIEPIFKGDNMQPADDPEPHISEQIFFYHVGNKVSKVVKDFIVELERIADADAPDDTISRQELKENAVISAQ